MNSNRLLPSPSEKEDVAFYLLHMVEKIRERRGSATPYFFGF
jgi:hypothetical protein